tara:strand:+ start:87 stop:710 length:624 start_codon:yes stop_codon:yes gene_type:complete
MGVSCPHCSKDVAGFVPEDRLSKMAADKREALAQLEAFKKETEEFRTKAETVEALTAELTEARNHAQSLTTSHTRQLDVYRHGLTDAEDVADLLAIYERRAPEGTALGEWLSNKDALPKAVSALLGSSSPASAPPEATPSAATPAEVVPANPMVNIAPPTPVASANAGAVATPAARAMPSASDISSMSIDEYKAHRDTLIAGLTQQR